MRKDKARAYGLRRQQKSYSEISRLLNIPKSTLADWFKKEEWSQKIVADLSSKESLVSPKKLKSIQKANKERWSKIYQSYRTAGETEFNSLKTDSLFISGIMLYWGAGSKNRKQSQLKLANTDPALIKTFYLFLQNTLRIPENKISVSLLLYPDLVDEMQKNFWSKSTGIPLSQFKKSTYIRSKNPARRLSYGICNICVQSREFKEKVLTWINLYQKHLLNNA